MYHKEYTPGLVHTVISTVSVHVSYELCFDKSYCGAVGQLLATRHSVVKSPNGPSMKGVYCC